MGGGGGSRKLGLGYPFIYLLFFFCQGRVHGQQERDSAQSHGQQG